MVLYVTAPTPWPRFAYAGQPPILDPHSHTMLMLHRYGDGTQCVGRLGEVTHEVTHEVNKPAAPPKASYAAGTPSSGTLAAWLQELKHTKGAWRPVARAREGSVAAEAAESWAPDMGGDAIKAELKELAKLQNKPGCAGATCAHESHLCAEMLTAAVRRWARDVLTSVHVLGHEL